MITTYAEMNKEIPNILRVSGRPLDLYAAQYIEELQSQVESLLAACEAALAIITGNRQDGTWGQHPDNPVPTQLRTAIAKAEGRE